MESLQKSLTGSSSSRLLQVACRRVLHGHDGPITALTYLPNAALIASASSDGTLRLWDPTARRHRLTHPSRVPIVRLHPGYNVSMPNEWTSAEPYCQVLQLRLGSGDSSSAPRGGRRWHCHQLEVLSLPGGRAPCRLILNSASVEKAEVLDSASSSVFKRTKGRCHV